MSDAILETCWFYWQALMNCLLLQGTIDCNQGCITCGILGVGHQITSHHRHILCSRWKVPSKLCWKLQKCLEKRGIKRHFFARYLPGIYLANFHLTPAYASHQRQNRLSTECELITQPLCCQTPAYASHFIKDITGYQRSASWSRNLFVAKPNHGLDQWEHS